MMGKPRTPPRRPALALATTPPTDPLEAPPSRGRLWYDFQIPNEFFGGLPGIEQKVRWVREHLPREKRVKIGRYSCWYETDISAYIESQREPERVKRLENPEKAAS